MEILFLLNIKMTKPKIPKKIPKERPERISPGIPMIPKKPDYPKEPKEIPKPKKPEEVPAYMPHRISRDYDLFASDYMAYRKYRSQIENDRNY